MTTKRKIKVYEHDMLVAGQDYKGVKFEQRHFNALADYLTLNPSCPYFRLLSKRVKFSHYVGVIKIGNLSIEVLPKSDRPSMSPDQWHNILLKMLRISLRVKSKTTTQADIHVKQSGVLETYIQLFLDETERIFRKGPVKKYRSHEGQQPALKGKLIFHKQLTDNVAHAERFFVSHQVYDYDNVYNAILKQTLQCILSLQLSPAINKQCRTLLLFFPQCRNFKVSEKVFRRLTYSRNTRRYQNAIELARIILLSYHPDLQSGDNNIIAIMVDMNHLWENYIFYILKKNAREFGYPVSIHSQRIAPFYSHPKNYNVRLRPDILIRKQSGKADEKVVVLDAKWKHNTATSVEDLRQMYAYGQYFRSQNSFLVYPEKLDKKDVRFDKGCFYMPGHNKKLSDQHCGLLFVDLLKESQLNMNLGRAILDACFEGS